MPKEATETTKNYYLDIDKAINIYNEKNPELKQLDKKTLAEMVGMTPQTLTNMKTKPLAKIINVVFEIEKIVGCKMKEIIISKDE